MSEFELGTIEASPAVDPFSVLRRPAGRVGRALAIGGGMGRRGETIEVTGVDLVVPTRPLVLVTELGDALKATPGGAPVFEIGDCLQPRTAFEAVQEGALIGHRL